jgi:UDP-4-amino-4,6-dideoxy-N-acetyl-beta-L-altrosamine transaminase
MDKLAIEGGRPVRDSLLPYGRQSLDEDDIRSVVDTLRLDWITQGPKVEEFEKGLADYCRAEYAIAVSSGTAALQLACAAAGITAGDEVITTPITFAATANAAVHLGARLVFADIKEDTLNISPVEIRKRLSLKTRAILPVDFAGLPAELDKIAEIARGKNITVIEDACHALGAEYGGRRVGSLADMTVFSFHPVKHITTGEGGMVLTNDEALYKEMRSLRHHGIVRQGNGEDPWYYRVVHPGYNFRITDFQCALGLSQMNKLDGFIKRRREIAARYDAVFSGMEEIVLPPRGSNSKHVYHIYVIQLRTEVLSAGRKEVFAALRAENIGVQVHYIPLHLHPFYRQRFGYKKGDYPVAERYYEKTITLPLFPAMGDGDVNDVIRAVEKVMAHYRKA